MAQQVNDDKKFTGVLLPANVKPIHYDLSLKPDLKKFTFDGKVKIEYNTNSQTPVNEVVVHSLDLAIVSGYVQKNEDKVCSLSKVTYSKTSETATLEFDGPVPDKGYLSLEFNGVLSDLMSGFYRTSFKLDDVNVYAATTQFEPTHARRCFPCWDEPAIKATFSTSLTYDRVTKTKTREYPNVALSNMPIIEQVADSTGDVLTAKYDKTPIVSTYLLAFIVGPFEFIEGSDGRRPHRVYTTPGKTEQGRFALDVSLKSLRYYEDYFKIDYPLKKMDLIAIPDFSSGAMENWGLVTYRESCLLVDPANTATSVKQYVALVVAHELAHQWFGNLVTMEWWTHLWLNEGFATFMEFLCVDHVCPEYDIWSQFSSDCHAGALSLDALHNSHPIEVPVNNPSEIDEIFDSISYNKGASVIRMLYQFIGDDSFRRGMHEYLTKYAYKNAITENLWECLEKASGKPVCRLMSGWTSKKGFPWLSVAYSREGDSSVKLSLTQTKFTADGTLPAEEANYTWMVPIDAVTGLNPTKTVSLGLLEGKEGTMTVEGAGDSWVKLNPGNVGLYRTAYPDEMAKKLLPAISAQTLPAIDRFGLQSDFFALCEAGKVKTSELLKLSEAYKGETNYTVWRSIDTTFGRLSSLLSTTEYKDKFHAFGRELYSEIFKKLTWNPQPNEKHTDAMLRALILNRLVSFGHETVIEEAKRRFKAHLDKVETIPADFRGVVYRAVSCHGDDESFNSLFELHRLSDMSEERNRLERALGLTTNSARLTRVIDWTFSDAVRNQDKIYVLIGTGSNFPIIAWETLKQRKDILVEMYKAGHMLTRVVSFCTNNLIGEDKVEEVSKFYEQNQFPGCERTIQQAIESIKLNTNWLARDKDDIKAFLSS